MALKIRSVWGAALVLAFACGAVGMAAAAAELEVQLQGIAHGQGSVKLALYASPEGFRKEDRALVQRTLPAQLGELTVLFPDLAEGRYALIAYHDENDNGELDKFLGMVPTEGYGLTNNPDVSGPPQFDQCALEVTGTTPTIVQIKY